MTCFHNSTTALILTTTELQKLCMHSIHSIICSPVTQLLMSLTFVTITLTKSRETNNLKAASGDSPHYCRTFLVCPRVSLNRFYILARPVCGTELDSPLKSFHSLEQVQPSAFLSHCHYCLHHKMEQKEYYPLHLVIYPTCFRFFIR